MVYIMPLVQLTSLFLSPSSSSRVSAISSLSSSSSVSTRATRVQSQEKQQDSVHVTSSTCKGTSQRRNGATASVLFLFLLDLWGVVPIIILITTTSILSNNVSSAVSIAAVSFNSSAYGNGKGNGAVNSGNFNNHHQKPSHSAPLPSKLSILTGNDAKGKGNTVGTINLPVGQLHFVNKLDDQEELEMEETNLKAIKNKGIFRKRNKRNNVGDTRITSNQDVTTLALAVDNSSSVAIANINSSFNSVFVSIGQNNFPNNNRYDHSSNRPPSYGDEDEF